MPLLFCVCWPLDSGDVSQYNNIISVQSYYSLWVSAQSLNLIVHSWMHAFSIATFKLVTSICQIDPSNPYTHNLISDLSYPCSFLGAASIIVSALYKRRVLSPRVHPIFVFSIADIMLSMLWIAGSALWLLRHSSMRRGWCFAASLMTVVSTYSPLTALINDQHIIIT